MLPSLTSVNKNLILAFAAGVVVGAVAYKYVKVEKKLNIDELSNNLKKLADHVATKGRGVGRGPNF